MGCFGSRAAGASLNCAEAPKAVRKTTADRQTKRLFPADLLKSIGASHALMLTPHSNSCLKRREREEAFSARRSQYFLRVCFCGSGHGCFGGKNRQPQGLEFPRRVDLCAYENFNRLDLTIVAFHNGRSLAFARH